MEIKSNLLEEEVYLNILKTQDLMTRQFMEFFRQYGMTSLVQYNVLRILRGADDHTIPSTTIGKRLINQVPDVTRIIDRMLKMGWVERLLDSSDRRKVLVRLTEKGHRLVNELDQPVSELHKTHLGHLSESELKQCIDLMIKIREGLNE